VNPNKVEHTRVVVKEFTKKQQQQQQIEKDRMNNHKNLFK